MLYCMNCKIQSFFIGPLFFAFTYSLFYFLRFFLSDRSFIFLKAILASNSFFMVSLFKKIFFSSVNVLFSLNFSTTSLIWRRLLSWMYFSNTLIRRSLFVYKFLDPIFSTVLMSLHLLKASEKFFIKLRYSWLSALTFCYFSSGSMMRPTSATDLIPKLSYKKMSETWRQMFIVLVFSVIASQSW